MKKYCLAAVLLITAAMAFSACGDSDEEKPLEPNTLTDVKVCTEIEEDQCLADETVFASDTRVIFVTGRLNNATAGTVVSASLRYLGNQEPQEIINTEVTITEVNIELAAYPVFYFTNDQPWVPGGYSVKVQVEGEEQQQVYKDFAIE